MLTSLSGSTILLCPKTSVTELQQVESRAVKALARITQRLLQRGSASIVMEEIEPLSKRSYEDVSIVIEIESVLELLAENVRLHDSNRIREYLLRFTEIIDVVPRAVDAARRHFPEAQLIMEVYEDPEIEDCYLVLYVRLKQYDDSIVERLERAEAEFLDHLADKEGWLQLTTDFREAEDVL